MRSPFLDIDGTKNHSRALSIKAHCPKRRSWFFRKLLKRILRSSEQVQMCPENTKKSEKRAKPGRLSRLEKNAVSKAEKNLEKPVGHSVLPDVDGVSEFTNSATRLKKKEGGGFYQNSKLPPDAPGSVRPRAELRWDRDKSHEPMPSDIDSVQSDKAKQDSRLVVKKTDVVSTQFHEKENLPLEDKNFGSCKRQGLEKQKQVTNSESNAAGQAPHRQQMPRQDVYRVVRHSKTPGTWSEVEIKNTAGQRQHEKDDGVDGGRSSHSSTKIEPSENVGTAKIPMLDKNNNAPSAISGFSVNDQAASTLSTNPVAATTSMNSSAPLRAEVPGMVEQLAARVSRALMGGRSSVSIRLDPPELGEINVVFSRKTGKLRVVLQCSHSSSFHLLQQEIGQLERRLAHVGVESALVALAQPESGGENNGSAFQGEADNAAVEHGDIDPVPGTVDAMDDAARHVEPESGLDLLA